MNRLVRLFQQKANNAWDKYLDERGRGVKEELDSPAWRASITLAAKFKATAETWEAAAKLLRQEELNR